MSNQQISNKDRWEVAHDGTLYVGKPANTSEINNEAMLKKLLSQNNWSCEIKEKKGCYYKVIIENEKLNLSKTLNIYFANIRKEDPRRNKEEKKIQLGANKDPRENTDYPTIILGMYVCNENDDIDKSIIVAWPLEQDKNYPDNPSLRVNMRKNIQQAKIYGINIDSTSGKRLVSFRPEFIFYYIENYEKLHANILVEDSTQYDNSIKNNIDKPYNRILFGAPGTGKSNILKMDSKLFNSNNYERVTFYPSYSYSQFVGTYKPKPISSSSTDITYEFVPGPFLRLLAKSYKNKIESKENSELQENYLLIIEEINRANVAAVFGDIFQLLDRKNGESEYSITTSEEMREYLAKTIGGEKSEYENIKIPDNLYIWATMNSADQGVFPMDTAFKRRWSFEYIDIDSGQNEIESNIVKLGNKKRPIKWNKLRTSINNKLISLNINEDKLLGPFFLNIDEQTSEEKFEIAFKNKVLMYLYEDVLRHKKGDFFKDNITTYSKLIKSYDEKGGDVFNFSLDYELVTDITGYNGDEQLFENNDKIHIAEDASNYHEQLETNEE